MSNKELLEERIATELANLDNKKGDDYTEAVDNIVKLYKLQLEEVKVDIEADEKYFRRQMDDKHHTEELQIQEKQLKTSIGDKLSSIAMELGTLLIGLSWSKRRFWEGLKFEETGTITSNMVRGISSKIFPKK